MPVRAAILNDKCSYLNNYYRHYTCVEVIYIVYMYRLILRKDLKTGSLGFNAMYYHSRKIVVLGDVCIVSIASASRDHCRHPLGFRLLRKTFGFCMNMVNFLFSIVFFTSVDDSDELSWGQLGGDENFDGVHSKIVAYDFTESAPMLMRFSYFRLRPQKM